MKFAWFTTFLLVLTLSSGMDAAKGKSVKKEVNSMTLPRSVLYGPRHTCKKGDFKKAIAGGASPTIMLALRSPNN